MLNMQHTIHGLLPVTQSNKGLIWCILFLYIFAIATLQPCTCNELLVFLIRYDIWSKEAVITEELSREQEHVGAQVRAA